MTNTRALHFPALGLVMLVGPAIWPGYFVDGEVRSVAWLVFLGGLQVAAGVGVLIVDGGLVARRLGDWIERSLEISVTMSDLPRAALPDSLFDAIDDAEQVAIARRLQRQLLRAA